MTEQTPYEPEQTPPSQPQQQGSGDWRDQRQEWRDQRHEWREQRREERREWREQRNTGPGAWTFGLALILIGGLILLRNAGIFVFENWWALFILIPAAGSFSTAWAQYQNAGGRLTAGARGSLVGGVILTMVAAMFLIGLNWGLLWPVLLILAGIGALLNALLPA